MEISTEEVLQLLGREYALRWKYETELQKLVLERERATKAAHVAPSEPMDHQRQVGPKLHATHPDPF
jgi:hypothetical protein